MSVTTCSKKNPVSRDQVAWLKQAIDAYADEKVCKHKRAWEIQKSHSSIPDDFQKILDDGYEPFGIENSNWVYFRRLKPCEECKKVCN